MASVTTHTRSSVAQAPTDTRSCIHVPSRRREATSTATVSSPPRMPRSRSGSQPASGSASCDAATLAAADVSGDGQVTSLDALMILQAAAGAIEL
ncbi:MAG: hypothetical protein EF813_09985 [Methanosarcinales archaeon]|nr:MAG: hypothetical protein EF813_09985 [Methanosarcinales archaeon]